MIENKGEKSSYWFKDTSIASFEALRYDAETEVGIVGGGLSGIVTGYLLAKEGFKVTIIEADTLFSGTTGYTTAKLTAQQGLIYDQLIQDLGMDTAKTHYKACTDAINFVKQTTKDLALDCQLKKQSAYIYTEKEAQTEKLEKEYEAYRKIGISGELTDSMPLDLPIKKALVMKEQYDYHPLHFLNGLVAYIIQHGGTIYEQTPAETIQEQDKPVIVTKNGCKLTCKTIVVASHFPFYDGMGFYFARLHAERSYVIAAKVKQEYPGGMYINADKPTRSVRTITDDNGERYLLIGGDGHRTGKGGTEEDHIQNLITFSKKLEAEEPSYSWSAQDLVTLDNLPYIGTISKGKGNIYVATGYRKWGMTNGIIAGLELTSLISEGMSQYKNIYQPSRFHAKPDLGKLTKNAVEVAKEFVIGKLEHPFEYVPMLANGEAKKVTINGLHVGFYRDEQGELHQVDTTCTHMKCEVNWNDADSSWDCPCHGSRFSGTGEVLEGPAKKPLKKLNDGLNS